MHRQCVSWIIVDSRRRRSPLRDVSQTHMRPARLRRRPPLGVAADAETMTTGARCFTTSPAELRWLTRRLETSGYQCVSDPARSPSPPPARRHHRPPSPSSVAPAHDDGHALRLVVTAKAGLTQSGPIERHPRKGGIVPAVTCPLSVN